MITKPRTCVSVCVFRGTCVGLSEDNIVESVLPLKLYVNSTDRTWIISKLLSQFARLKPGTFCGMWHVESHGRIYNETEVVSCVTISHFNSSGFQGVMESLWIRDLLGRLEVPQTDIQHGSITLSLEFRLKIENPFFWISKGRERFHTHICLYGGGEMAQYFLLLFQRT